MKVKIEAEGTFPGTFRYTDKNGKSAYIKAGKQLRTPIEIGKTYEIENALQLAQIEYPLLQKSQLFLYVDDKPHICERGTHI